MDTTTAPDVKRHAARILLARARALLDEATVMLDEADQPTTTDKETGS